METGRALEQVHQRAARAAKLKKAWRFVVYDCGEYAVASEFDLDTFYQGISDQHILACYGPDGIQN